MWITHDFLSGNFNTSGEQNPKCIEVDARASKSALKLVKTSKPEIVLKSMPVPLQCGGHPCLA